MFLFTPGSLAYQLDPTRANRILSSGPLRTKQKTMSLVPCGLAWTTVCSTSGSNLGFSSCRLTKEPKCPVGLRYCGRNPCKYRQTMVSTMSSKWCDRISSIHWYLPKPTLLLNPREESAKEVLDFKTWTTKSLAFLLANPFRN